MPSVWKFFRKAVVCRDAP